MRYIALLILPVIFFTACRKNKLREDYIYYRYCTFTNHAHIDGYFDSSRSTYHYNIVPDSNQIVFTYLNGRDIKNANDAGSGYTLTFQTDSSAQSFVYKDEDLAQHLSYFESYEGWGGYGQILITKGSLSGQKQADGTWNINIDIKLPKKDDITGISGFTDNITATKNQPL